jgi:hypothetical protein
VTLISKALPRFWLCYEQLPPAIQRRADKQYCLFASDPDHPSLQFKPVGPFWSVRVSQSYRALAIKKGSILHWFWIGTHDEYERLLRGKEAPIN